MQRISILEIGSDRRTRASADFCARILKFIRQSCLSALERNVTLWDDSSSMGIMRNTSQTTYIDWISDES